MVDLVPTPHVQAPLNLIVALASYRRTPIHASTSALLYTTALLHLAFEVDNVGMDACVQRI
jgi:hypothetical protein